MEAIDLALAYFFFILFLTSNLTSPIALIFPASTKDFKVCKTSLKLSTHGSLGLGLKSRTPNVLVCRSGACFVASQLLNLLQLFALKN